MRPTPFRLLAGRSMTLAAMLMLASISVAQSDRVHGGVQTAGSAVAQGTEPKRDGVVLLGGALPGGAILSSAVASLTPAGGAGGGAASASYAATGRAAAPAVTSPVGEDGSFSFTGLAPGAYELRISFPAGPRQTTDTSTTRQTQGATFGEKVNQGLQTAGAAKTKHDTAKNAIGNVRAHDEQQAGGVRVAVGDVDGDGRAESKAKHDTAMGSVRNIKAHEETQAGGVQVAVGDVTGDGRAESAQAAVSRVSTMSGGAGGGAAAASYAKTGIDGGMPNRISMNVTTPKLNFTIEAGGAPVVVQVGADGTFTARASVNQQQQGAEPASSDRRPPKGEPPPRPAGG